MAVELGADCRVAENVDLGVAYTEGSSPAVIGDKAVIRSRSVIYEGVQIGDEFVTGHSVLIREQTRIGDRVVAGTNSVVEGNTEIGNDVKLVTGAYVPTHTTIGDHVFVGPKAVMTNDMYPQRRRDEYEPRGPTLSDNVTLGANATVLPDITIGEGAMVAAGSVVTEDVPDWHLARGVPAQTEPLREELCEPNRATETQ